MALVKTCFWCGLVNDAIRIACSDCGASLPILALRQPHRPVGSRVDVGRPRPEEVASRLGGGSIVVLPDRRVAVVRRRWTDHGPWWGRPPRDIGATEFVSQAIGRANPRALGTIEDAGEALVMVLLFPVALAVRVIRTVFDTIDLAGKVLAQCAGLRGWPVEAVFDRGEPRRILWLIKGRGKQAVDEIVAALHTGDLDFRAGERAPSST
jgi:hypothetical protein